MNDLGEMVKDVSAGYEDFVKYTEETSEIITNGTELRVDQENPVLNIPKKDTFTIRHCKSCGNELGSIDVDGECTKCALKRLRTLETKLAQLNKIKQEHEFCPVEGHGEVYKNKLHQDWCGKIVINGVELYPVFPLCKACLDTLTAYLVFFLEQRGIMRKGDGHSKNIYGDPYGEALSIREKQDAVERLKEFIRIITLYTMDSNSTTSELYSLLKERRTRLLQSDQKGIKEWQKEREVKLPTNQLEFLKLAEKYYLCLRKDGIGEQEKKSKEIEWLKTQPVPEEVKRIEEKKFIEVMAKYIPLVVLNNLKEQDNLNNGRLNNTKLTVKELIHRLGDACDNGKWSTDLWKTMITIIGSDIIPFADFAEGILTEIVEKYTMSDLISKLMTERSKQEQSKSVQNVSTGYPNI